MCPTDRLGRNPFRRASQTETQELELLSLEGTIQRINYRTGEMSVVAGGRLWSFAVAADCRIWFDGRQALLRCFHPLDHICVYYEPRPDERHLVRALFGSESADRPG